MARVNNTPSLDWSTVSWRNVMAGVSAAERPLVGVLRLETAGDDPGPCRALIEGVRDWDAVLAAARVHGLQPLLYGALSRNGLLGALPEPARARLKQAYLLSAALTAFGLSELDRVLRALPSEEVPALVLKGPVLGPELYHDPAERPFSDLDLVVPEEAWERFRARLIALGYQPGTNDCETLPLRLLPQVGLDHVCEFHGPQRLNLDVKFDPLELGLRMRDARGVWQRSVTSETRGGVAMRRPAPDDELLMLCVHLNRHGYQRLLWLSDVSLYLARRGAEIDWRTLAERAHPEGVAASVHYTLRLAELLLSAPVPPRALVLTQPAPAAGRAWRSAWPLADVLAFDGVHEGPLVFRKRLTCRWLPRNLLLTGRTAEKSAYFARRILPPREFLLDKYRGADGRTSYVRALGRRYRSLLTRPWKAEV